MLAVIVFFFFLKDPKQKSVIFLECEFLKDEVVFTCFYHINVLLGKAYFKLTAK